MPGPLELSGLRVGNVVVISLAYSNRNRGRMWNCRCDCGTEFIAQGSRLRAGKHNACEACLRSRPRKHGASRTSMYYRWRGILGRCENPNYREYDNYGGRGIKVCARWHEFENFWADMSDTYRPGMEIDRIDNDGDYTPENCRWVEHQQNQRNKRTNHLITWQGKTQTAIEWSEEIGINANTLIYRLRRGWDLDRAMTQKPMKPKPGPTGKFESTA